MEELRLTDIYAIHDCFKHLKRSFFVSVKDLDTEKNKNLINECMVYLDIVTDSEKEFKKLATAFYSMLYWLVQANSNYMKTLELPNFQEWADNYGK